MSSKNARDNCFRARFALGACYLGHSFFGLYHRHHLYLACLVGSNSGNTRGLIIGYVYVHSLFFSREPGQLLSTTSFFRRTLCAMLNSAPFGNRLRGSGAENLQNDLPIKALGYNVLNCQHNPRTPAGSLEWPASSIVHLSFLGRNLSPSH